MAALGASRGGRQGRKAAGSRGWVLASCRLFSEDAVEDPCQALFQSTSGQVGAEHRARFGQPWYYTVAP